MSAAASRSKAHYRRHCKDKVTISRSSGTGASIAWTDATDIRANIRGYGMHEIAGAIVQGDQEVMLLADDLTRNGFEVPPKRGDRITKPDATTATVQAVGTRRAGGELIAYVCQVRGG